MISKKHLITLVMVTVAGFVIAFVTTPNKDFSLLINSLSIGLVVSGIFFWVVVYWPERKRRNFVYRSMEKQYRNFKLSCIHTFLILSNSQDYPDRETLLDQSEFKRYFKNNNANGKNRWGEVVNGIEENQYYLNEILYELRLLNEEIRFVRNTIDIHDEEVFSYMNNLSHIIHRMESTTPDYDSIKTFSRYLWEIFAGWSFVSGYSDEDIIQSMIERIK